MADEVNVKNDAGAQSLLTDGLGGTPSQWYAHKHAPGVWSVARGFVVGVDFEYSGTFPGTMRYQVARKMAKEMNSHKPPNAKLTDCAASSRSSS